MKKFILIIIALFISTNSFSQELDLGIKAGANFATITDYDNASSITGFLAGAFATIKFSDKIAIQGDLLYSQQGANFDAEELDLDYINFPIVLKYYLFKRLNIHAGSQFGFLINDTNLGTESYDLSGVIGVGLDLPLGLRVDGRYNFGVTDILDIVNVKGKNSVFSLSLGFSFI